MSEGQIVHIEFAASDPDAAGKFYSDLFGWKTEAYPGAEYTTFEPVDPPGGGFARNWPVQGAMLIKLHEGIYTLRLNAWH